MPSNRSNSERDLKYKIMGDEDLYVGDVRNYYNTQRIIVRADEHPGLICSSSIPDGKSQRRESRRRAIRRRKGRL